MRARALLESHCFLDARYAPMIPGCLIALAVPAQPAQHGTHGGRAGRRDGRRRQKYHRRFAEFVIRRRLGLLGRRRRYWRQYCRLPARHDAMRASKSMTAMAFR